MNLSFFPERASSIAGQVDLLTLALTGVTVFFSLLIFAAIIYFAVKYRRGNKVDRSNPPHENVLIETVWTVIPLGIAMGLFVWSTVLYFHMIRPPAGAMEIYVTGKQWMWKIQHPEGRWENNELHVPLGRTIKLTMTSEDVIHAFFVPEFRIKMDVNPGRYTQMWFTPTKLGTFKLFCAEFCGTDHSRMTGSVTVMEPADYEAWLRTGTTNTSLAGAGEQLFIRHGCSGCHGRNSSVRAPLLNGIYNRSVPVQIPRAGTPLADIPATTVIADERYLHDAIVLPEKEIAAGYSPIMPTFKGRLREDEIVQLISYIKSLETPGGQDRAAPRLDREDIRSRTGFTPPNIGDITRQGGGGAAGGTASPGNTPYKGRTSESPIPGGNLTNDASGSSATGEREKIMRGGATGGTTGAGGAQGGAGGAGGSPGGGTTGGALGGGTGNSEANGRTAQ